MIYHLYALRLLDALSTQPEALFPLKALRVLSPIHPLTLPESNDLLLGRVTEMEALMHERVRITQEMEQRRDRGLEEGFAAIEQQVTLHPSDSWQEVIIKARVLRDLGRPNDAIAAFQAYGKRFGETDERAIKYAQAAVRFTEYLSAVGGEGGLFVQSFDPESPAQQAGLLLEDIVVKLQGQNVAGMDELLPTLMKIAPNTPLVLDVLRWDQDQRSFTACSISVAQKPVGVEFLPI